MTTIDEPPEDAVCGCDCGCDRPLTSGNAMGEDVTHKTRAAWEAPSLDEVPVLLLICADCYVGAHPSRQPR